MVEISVIIPTYKPQEYLWRCLDSFNNQTLAKGRFELVLVLNGCKEPYHTDILDYIRWHPLLDIKYIQLDEGGVSNARNVGIDNSVGDYITFIDDDDYVSSVYLESLLSVVGNNVMSISNAAAIENDKVRPYVMERIFRYNKENDKHLLCQNKKYLSGPWMKLLHRDIIGDRRFDVRFTNGEDSLFMFKISDRIKRVEFSSEDALYYRCFRSDSLFTRKRPFLPRFKNYVNLIIEYTKIYFSNPLKYSFFIYITRIAASFHSAISDN